MNYSIYRFTLDIHKTKSQVAIPILLGDTNVRFYMSINDGGNPYHITEGCVAKIAGKKTNGHIFFHDCEIEDNRIVYTFTPNTANVRGVTPCEVRIYGPNGGVITTPRFFMAVEEKVVLDEELDEYIESFTDIAGLDGIIVAERQRVAAEEERITAETERSSAEVARINAELERVASELERLQAEASRVTAELSRVSAEQARDQAETNRATAEVGRADAETARAVAETNRVAAESERHTFHQSLIDAKNSGEFDGEDGISVTHKWVGTTLEVTSASGTSSADLKGDDYVLTDNDKEHIADLVDADGKIFSHNTGTDAHNDIRLLITALNEKLNNFLDVDDITKDELSEVIALIEGNQDLIDGITTSKVNIADIIDNLTTPVTDKPLSANQGVKILELIDSIGKRGYLTEVNEETVVFKDDLVTTYEMGNYKLTNGMATIPAKGKTLKKVWELIYKKEIQPTITQPSYTFTASGGSGEVGTSFTLPTATFKVTSVGSYSYNDTGIKFSGSITGGDNTKSFENLITGDVATVKISGNATTYTDDAIKFSFSGKYSYNEGATPLTNLGNVADKDGIAAVTDKAISTSCSFTGYRKMFIGCLTSEQKDFTSDEVRAFDKVSTKASTSTQSFTVPSGTKQIVVAYPASLTSNSAKTPTFEYEALGQWFTEGNIKQLASVEVEGANGASAVTYYIYSYTHTGTFASDTNYKITI